MTSIRCPICTEPLKFSLATSRRAKKKKAFIMLVCPNDGRHFRGFISDQNFVSQLVVGTSSDWAEAITGMGKGKGKGKAPFSG
ncbi:hypothetical protein ACFLX9_02705 [Chloroflexota bacterium]